MQLTKDELDALADQHRVPGHATMIDHRAFAAAVIAEHTAKVLEDVEPVAWLDTVIDWTATGQPITRRICIQAQCGDWALSYIESALRETASTIAALKSTHSAEVEALKLRMAEDKAGYDIMGLAEEQRQKRGPFGGPGTPNSLFADTAKTSDAAIAAGERQHERNHRNEG